MPLTPSYFGCMPAWAAGLDGTPAAQELEKLADLTGRLATHSHLPWLPGCLVHARLGVPGDVAGGVPTLLGGGVTAAACRLHPRPW